MEVLDVRAESDAYTPGIHPGDGVLSVDGQPPEIVELPTSHAGRRYAPLWRYNLPAGRHTVRITVRPLPADTTLFLERVIIYGPEPKRPPV